MPEGYGPLERAADIGDAINPVAFGARMAGHGQRKKKQTKSDMDKLQTAIEIVGMFDQSGIADTGNAIMYLMRAIDEPEARSSHFKSAAMSAVGAIPLIGSFGPIAKRTSSFGNWANKSIKAGAKAVPGGQRAYGLARTLQHKHPGKTMKIAGQLAGMLNILATGSRDRSDKVRDITGSLGQMGRAAKSEPGALEGVQALTGMGFDMYQDHQPYRYGQSRGGYSNYEGLSRGRRTPPYQQMRGRRGMEQARYGGYAYGGGPGPNDPDYDDPYDDDYFAMRQRKPSRTRSIVRGAGRLASIQYQNSPAAWAGLGAGAGLKVAGASAMLPYTMAGFGFRAWRGAGKMVARTGVAGPIAAHMAGGWYGNPKTVARGMGNLARGLLKAVAGLVLFTQGMRISNRVLMARQSHLVGYGATMANAHAKFEMEQSIRYMKMAGLTGASYARLTQGTTNLEEATQPYRAAGTNIANSGGALLSNIAASVIEIAGTMSGVLTIAETINWLLGGTGETVMPHQKLMIDIAAGDFTDDGPTVPPRT